MSVYYNELDPFCIQWMRNLMAAGEIDEGEIDTRDIRLVQPDDVRGFDVCHFFAGIGGWSLAFRYAGISRWPRRLWSASLPCQPWSIAGQAGGVLDERHLWPAFRRLIPESDLPDIFGEQVASEDGRAWLSGVRLSLEALGYACGAADLCSAGFGADHIRQRIYWMAHAERRAAERQRQHMAGTAASIEGEAWERQRIRLDAGTGGDADAGGLADTGHDECGRRNALAETETGAGRPPHADACGGGSGEDESRERTVDDVADGGTGGGMAESDGTRRQTPGRGSQVHAGQQPVAGRRGVVWMGDTGAERLQVSEHGDLRDQGRGQEGRAVEQPSPASAQGLGDAEGDGRGQEHAHARGRASGSGEEGLAERFGSDVCLVPCADGVYRRIESGTFPLAYGIPQGMGRREPGLAGMVAAARSNRSGRLKGYGNAIDPRVAAEFIHTVMECMP